MTNPMILCPCRPVVRLGMSSPAKTNVHADAQKNITHTQWLQVGWNWIGYRRIPVILHSVPYPVFYLIFFLSDLRTGYGSFRYWYLSHIHIRNTILVFGFGYGTNWDTDYPYRVDPFGTHGYREVSIPFSSLVTGESRGYNIIGCHKCANRWSTKEIKEDKCSIINTKLTK